MPVNLNERISGVFASQEMQPKSLEIFIFSNCQDTKIP